MIAESPGVFAQNDSARPGGLFDHLAALDDGKTIAAPEILSELLHELGPIWPSRITLGGIPLGDCWRHPAMKTSDATNGIVPIHKLSQWLAYSLIEPLQRGGIAVTDIDGLTGLAEYRNGGLFVDSGVLVIARSIASGARARGRLRTRGRMARADRRAARPPRRHASVQRLNMDAVALPLAKILEGGTWAAGRAIAREKRADGTPPITVISDGTVF